MRQKIYILITIFNVILANCYSQNNQCPGSPNLPGSSAASPSGAGGSGFTPSCDDPGGNQLFNTLNDGFGFYIFAIGSWDPNLIVTPLGFDSAKWVSVHDNMGVTIYFENDPNLATAPVHNAYVYYKFGPKQNPASFRIGSFGFNGMIFTVPPGLNFYQTRLDLRDSLGLYVDVTAGINIVTNTAFWIFQSIDSLTNLPPADPLKGFLPIKDSSSTTFNDASSAKGEGFVNFTVAPLNTDQTRDTIFATAKIVFDTNDTIPTNVDFNTVDAVAPTSRIYLATLSHDTISLFWSGTDDARGSGIKDYSLYVSQDGGPFIFYKLFSGLTTNFIGAPGSTCCFFVRARDNVDNMEAALKNICEVSINLSGGPLPLTWLYFKGQEKADDVELSWATGSEINTAYFGVERSLNGRDFEQIDSVIAAGNSNLTSSYQYLDKYALRLNAPVIYYRLRQVDKDGKSTYSNVIAFSIRKDNGQLVKVYPNPFSQNIMVQISTVNNAEASDLLELYSVNGSLLYRKSLANRQNNTPIELNDLPELASGTYILHTILNGENNSIKLIKQ